MISIGKKSGVIWIETNSYPKFSPGGFDSIEGDAFSSDVVFPYTRSFGIGTKRLQELVWVNGLFNSRVVYLNTNHWKSHTHTHTPTQERDISKVLATVGNSKLLAHSCEQLARYNLEFSHFVFSRESERAVRSAAKHTFVLLAVAFGGHRPWLWGAWGAAGGR